VDDVVQDVFLAVYRSLGRFRDKARIDTWLTTITLNRCRSVRRWRWLRLRLPWRATVQGEAIAEPPDRPAENAELLAEVRQAVRQLPQTDREAIVLRYLEGASVDAIAGLLGVSRGAVEVRLSRARNRLRDLLSPNMEQ
jgi:RNA polymerase sigma-70 factor, ECF subfamily